MSGIKGNDDWLKAVIPLHERLSATAASLVISILKKSDIEFLSVTARTKTVDTALEKIQRKEYQNPKQDLTDLSGVRIVTYLEDQATQITNVIRGLFEIDKINSHDRSADLGEDKMGYRSTHFVCTLGKDRASLPEYDGIGDLKFEIQIRTVLQHAWAELAHDRSFKFGTALPARIQRKLNLYSGMLEIVDSAFDEIAKEIDHYKVSLSKETSQQISTAEIDSISIARLAADISKELKISVHENTSTRIVEELKHFGLKNIGDVQSLVTNEFKTAYAQHRSNTTTFGILRDLMMFNDLHRYFELKPAFQAIGYETINLLETKYEREEIKKYLNKFKIATSGRKRKS